MANNIDWGQGAINNNIGWGQGAKNNSIGWGTSHFTSAAGETEIYGLRQDADVTAFLSATAITDTTTQSAIDTLVLDLKAYGLWSKMKAIYPFVGGTAATHSYNLKNTAAHQITWFGGLTHDSTGVTPNGTNGYGNLNFNPRTHIGTQSSYGTYCGTNIVINSKNDFGSTNLDGFEHYINLLQFGTAQYTQFRGAGNNIGIANTSTNAFFHAGLDTSNNLFLFKNSTLLQTKTPVTIGTPPLANTYLFALNSNGTAKQFTPRPSSFFFAASGTTQEDNGNIYYCIQKFQTTLGRQVGTPIYSSNATDVNARLFLGATNIQDATITSAVDTLVQGLKTDGVWSKLKAVYPFVGSTPTTHKFNLVNSLDEDSAFRLTFSGGWSHDLNGATPNGVNGFANTFLTPQTNLTLGSHSFGMYSRTSDIVGNKVYGSSTLTFYLQQNVSAGNFISGSVSNLLSYTPSPTIGLMVGTRTSTTLFKAFRNNLLLGSDTVTASSIPNVPFYFGARNENNSSSVFFNTYQHAFAFLGDGLSDTEASNLYTRVQAFQTTLNRQV